MIVAVWAAPAKAAERTIPLDEAIVREEQVVVLAIGLVKRFVALENHFTSNGVFVCKSGFLGSILMGSQLMFREACFFPDSIDLARF